MSLELFDLFEFYLDFNYQYLILYSYYKWFTQLIMVVDDYYCSIQFINQSILLCLKFNYFNVQVKIKTCLQYLFQIILKFCFGIRSSKDLDLVMYMH